MVKRIPILKRILASFLLGIFFFAITPHEFIHELLSHHQDTVDFVHHDVEVGNHHIHCDYLHMAHMPLLSETVEETPALPLFNQDRIGLVSYGHVQAFTEYFSLRGPPLS